MHKTGRDIRLKGFPTINSRVDRVGVCFKLVSGATIRAVPRNLCSNAKLVRIYQIHSTWYRSGSLPDLHAFVVCRLSDGSEVITSSSAGLPQEH
jgi:hypothetical protein